MDGDGYVVWQLQLTPVLQVAHVRQLGMPHLVVAFDAKVEETCRKYSILYHRDDEGTAEGCGVGAASGGLRLHAAAVTAGLRALSNALHGRRRTQSASSMFSLTSLDRGSTSTFEDVLSYPGLGRNCCCQ